MSKDEIVTLIKAINRIEGVIKDRASVTAGYIRRDVNLINEILINNLKEK